MSAATAPATKTATATAAPKTVAPVVAPAPVTASVMTQERVKKITSKLFKSIEIGKANGVKVAGVVRLLRKKPSVLDSSKEFCAFYGDFRLQMGNTVYVSNELILPQYPESVIENGYNTAFEAAGEGVAPSVTFAMLVYREKDDSPKNARGFQWALDEIKPIAPVNIENDPLLKLLA